MSPKPFLFLVMLLVCTTLSWGYIDPGTGSMLFSALSGVVVAVYFFIKSLMVRLKSLPALLVGRQKRIAAATGRPYVVYSEGRQYWGVFRTVLEEFDRRGLSVMYYTSDPGDPGLEFRSDHVATALLPKGHAAFFTLNTLDAQVCLTTTPGLDVYHWKRSPKVGRYVHILHAPNDATLYRLFGLDYYDVVLLGGAFQEKGIRDLEAQRRLAPKQLVVVGVAYLDAMKTQVDRALASLPPREGATVLVSPSWGASGLLRKYGMALLGPLARSGLHTIVRPHPQSRTSEAAMLGSLTEALAGYPNVVWDFDRDNLPSMAQADVMISDFSGIIFDFVFQFSRPVLYTKAEFDLRPYDASDLAEPTWTFQTLPKIGRELLPADFERVAEVVNEVTSDPRTKSGIDQARAEAWSYPGEAARRVVDALEALVR